MRHFAVASFIAVAGVVEAQEMVAEPEWRFMSGAEISIALTDRKLDYGAQWQEFYASGRTLYVSGQDTWGYWAVRDDQYCSLWPPSDLWACYAMQTNETGLRFVGDGGEITEATYKDK